VLNDVEVLALRHVRRVLRELRRVWIERVANRGMEVLTVPVAARAIRLIVFHSGSQVVIRGLQRVVRLWCAPIDGGIEGRHGDVAFEPTDRSVRARVNETEAHIAEAGCQHYNNGYCESEKKLGHGGSPLGHLNTSKLSASQISVPNSKPEHELGTVCGFTSLPRIAGGIAVFRVVGEADVGREFATNLITEAQARVQIR